MGPFSTRKWTRFGRGFPTLTYSYDGAGNLQSITDSKGGSTNFTYDDNRVVKKTYSDSLTQMAVTFTYDGNGNVLTETRYSDTAGTQLQGGNPRPKRAHPAAKTLVQNGPTPNPPCKLVHHRFTVCQLQGGEGWSSRWTSTRAFAMPMSRNN